MAVAPEAGKGIERTPQELNLARRVERERRRRGISARELGRLLEDVGARADLRVPPENNGVSRLESGARRPSIDDLVAISRVLGITVDDLLTPVELVEDREAAALVEGLLASVRVIQDAAEACWDGIRQLVGPERHELTETSRSIAMEQFGQAVQEIKIDGHPCLVEPLQWFLMSLISGGVRESIERAGGPRIGEPFPDETFREMVERMEVRDGER